jgi:hypothetical protein
MKNGFIFMTSEHTQINVLKFWNLKKKQNLEAVFNLNELKNVEA